MSIKLLDRCWRFSQSKGGDLLVLLATADFSNDEGTAYPSIATLARKARLTIRNTQRAIRRLIARGELEVNENRGPHRTHLYRITLPDGNQSEGRQNVRMTKRQDDNCDGRGVTFQPYKPSEETVTKRQGQRDDKTSLPAKDTEDQYSAGFDVFYNAYPKKEGKGACRKWWAKKKPDEALLSIMVFKIEQAKQTPKWKEQGGRFIPMPLTWLFQERWEDEYPPAVMRKERIPL